MTTFGGATVPPLFVGGSAADIVTDIIVGNSVSTGIVAWGGWAFPIDAVPVRGHYRVATRDDSGDTINTDQNWSGEPPIDPPDYVFQVFDQAGDMADFGNQSWRLFNSFCSNISNGARWERAAGVAASLSIFFRMEWQVASGPNTCPGVSVFVNNTYQINATFTG